MDQIIRIGDRFRSAAALGLGDEVTVSSYAYMPYMGLFIQTLRGTCYVSEEFLLNPACFTRIGSTRLPEIPE